VDIEPDTKDWTWVLDRPCHACGFDARTVTTAELAPRIVANAAAWSRVLTSADAHTRPAPTVWSPLEYACHVRDVHLVFDGRLHLMLDQDDPVFANWNQDQTAVEKRYDLEDPEVVAVELSQAAAAVAATYSSVAPDQWERPGRRSNGSVFTVESMGPYHLHDVVHHLRDVDFDVIVTRP